MENQRTSTHTVTVLDENGKRQTMSLEIRYSRLEEYGIWEETAREGRLENGEVARHVGDDLYETPAGARLRVVP